MLVPVAISCNLFAILERYEVVAQLSGGVRHQLAEAKLMLDPMDNGMLQEGEHIAYGKMLLADWESTRQAGESMSCDELLDYAIEKLS